MKGISHESYAIYNVPPYRTEAASVDFHRHLTNIVTFSCAANNELLGTHANFHPQNAYLSWFNRSLPGIEKISACSYCNLKQKRHYFLQFLSANTHYFKLFVGVSHKSYMAKKY